MSDERFQSFEEFWPFYVREHSNKWNRRLHFVGTTCALGLAGAALVTKKRWLLALAPVAGYGAAWVGHFFIEKNRPATFKYPLWSLRGDFKMWAKMVTFKMDAEVEKVMSAEREKQTASSATAEPAAQPSAN
jgi:hypothetical protein